MSSPTPFRQLFAEAVAAQGWRRLLSPTEVLGAWEQLVDLIEDGYEGSIYEYTNDLSVRDLIETLFRDETLRNAAEMRGFRDRVAAIDERARSLLGPEPVAASQEQPWWRASVPRYAGAELAADLRSTYGVTVDER